MKVEKINIIFLEGLEPRHNMFQSFVGYLFPVASVLEESNLSFKILSVKNMLEFSIQGIINELRNYNFDAIGMSTTADSIRFVYKVCNAIKKEFPSKKIILGGPQVSFSDQRTLKECPCDVIVRHEGDITLKLILECIEKGISYDHIKGITYRKDREIIRNNDAAPIDINLLPTPQFAILSNNDYWIIPKGLSESEFNTILKSIKKSYPFFITGRGCPYQCAFCVEGNMKNSSRHRSPANVKKDLEYYLLVINSNYIVIADDTFTSSPQRVKDLCDVFKDIQQTHPFTWFCEGRVDVLSRHPEMISMMYNVGLKKLQIGIESGNQKVLDIYNKKITLKQMETVVKEAAKYEKLLLHGNIILGNPKETFTEFRDSINHIIHLIELSNFNLDISKSYLTPYFGTPIRSNPEKFDLEILVDDFEFSRFGMGQIVCKPNSLSINELNSQHIIVESEISNFINNNIFNLPKKIILKHFLNQSEQILPTAWTKSFGKLTTFKRYLRLLNRETTKEIDDDSSDSYYTLSPLRLWDIDYDHIAKKYNFISLNGDEISIQGEEIVLWEMATGKKNLHEIYSDLKLITEALTLNFVFSFYKHLETKMAIAFVDF